ncbi:hypothetical protein C0J52_06932 [Blattella germanica]|nr:hypothetical protein C0J52_06932 [Blattella germanica]
MKYWTACLLLILLTLDIVRCWDNDELEIFDLVEEVNTNFYTLLGVTELVAVYDVLRDSNKRKRYNEVLKNGLPDWRQAVYYYRRVRKMGLAEMSVILFVLVTVGQYIVSWAAYLEKKYTAEQFLNMRLKKLQKKQKKGKYDGPALPETIILDIPMPSIWNTLPFQLPRWVFWFFVVFCPSSVTAMKDYWAERKRRKEMELEQSSEEEEETVEVEVRGPRRRKGRGFTVPEAPAGESELPVGQPPEMDQGLEEEPKPPPSAVSGGLWTDDDLAELVRLVKKFPPGTPARWEKIASNMGRSVSEVTHMAKKVKEDGYRVAASEPVESEPPKPTKVKTRAAEAEVAPEWSQVQQKALEAALINRGRPPVTQSKATSGTWNIFHLNFRLFKEVEGFERDIVFPPHLVDSFEVQLYLCSSAEHFNLFEPATQTESRHSDCR